MPFAFSPGEKVAEGRMRGQDRVFVLLQLAKWRTLTQNSWLKGGATMCTTVTGIAEGASL